jgi:hypothetical protein
MAVWKLMVPLTSCAIAFWTLPGCSLSLEPDTSPTPVDVSRASGTITVDWLVAGVKDSGLCAMYGADEIEVVIDDASGGHVATANSRCRNFSLSVPLPEGTYTADVTLVDRAGNAITTTKTLYSLDVVGGTDLAVQVDFPTSSVL